MAEYDVIQNWWWVCINAAIKKWCGIFCGNRIQLTCVYTGPIHLVRYDEKESNRRMKHDQLTFQIALRFFAVWPLEHLFHFSFVPSTRAHTKTIRISHGIAQFICNLFEVDVQSPARLVWILSLCVWLDLLHLTILISLAFTFFRAV